MPPNHTATGMELEPAWNFMEPGKARNQPPFQWFPTGLEGQGKQRKRHAMSVVRAMFRSHPEHPAHSDAITACIDACSLCIETCTACADACLSEKHLETMIACIRLNLDCAAVCAATGSVMARANKAGNRQPLEAQLTTCIAFCRACASECGRHADKYKHCRVCADACTSCADACTQMLSSLRMPA
jgi:hypothetical protein